MSSEKGNRKEEKIEMGKRTRGICKRRKKKRGINGKTIKVEGQELPCPHSSRILHFRIYLTT